MSGAGDGTTARQSDRSTTAENPLLDILDLFDFDQEVDDTLRYSYIGGLGLIAVLLLVIVVLLIIVNFVVRRSKKR